MPDEQSNVFAFIDGQNLYLGTKNDFYEPITQEWYGLVYKGWKLDYKKLRIYLRDKYRVEKAYYFIGYDAGNSILYKSLQEFGYIVSFKPTFRGPNGMKGNCDAELVLQAMIDFPEYDKAIIVTGDGDFGCLVKYLISKNKLETVLAPNYEKSSWLLREAAQNKYIAFMNGLEDKLKLEVKKEKSSIRTKPFRNSFHRNSSVNIAPNSKIVK
ncbi:MAG: NYN domain-containing protein [bacterium]|nr:NYN domain-containing protein [bacterium]